MDWLDDRCPDALTAAREARERAYVPYSGFRMGAAVVTSTGATIPGTLVENVSLGLAMCAERVALFSSVARGEGRPQILALVAKRTNKQLTFPCGACLQVALELGGLDLIVVASDPDGDYAQARLAELAGRLPHKPR